MFESLLDPYNYPFWIITIAVIAGAIAIISRPFSTYVKFVYPNAKFEAMGNPFVGDKELDSVAESKDILSFKETINTLKDYNISGGDTYSIQKSLDETFIETVTMMRKDSSKKMNNFYDVYLEKMDMHIVKHVIIRKLDGKNISDEKIDEAILPKTKKLLKKLVDVEKNDLPKLLRDYGFGKEIIETVLEEQPDFLKIDTTINKHILNNFKQTQVPYKCEQGKQLLIKTITDITNIKSVLRAKQLNYDAEACKLFFVGEGREIPPWKYNELAELESVSQIITSLEGTSYYNILKDSIEKYNKDKSVQVLELALDQLFLSLVKEISIQYYINIGPTLRFLVSKEFEIRNLKVIVKGISENLPADFIKNLLVKEAI